LDIDLEHCPQCGGDLKMIALATVGGILVGNRLYHLVHARFFRWPAEVCG